MSPDQPDIKTAAPIPLNEDVTILPAQPRSALNKKSVQVFAAQGDGRAPTNLLAYICDPALSPRTIKGSNYAAIHNPHMMRLIAAGSAIWESERKRKYCFVYEDTIAKPLLAEGARPVMGLKSETVINGVLKPMVGVFYDLQNTDIVHGAIHPGNMYGTLSGNTLEKFVLGECLSLPASYEIPALYETIERMMAQPAGRGTGTLQDDLYALGASLAVMMRYADPMDNLSLADMIRYKQEQGSFNAFFGKETVNGNHVDLIRGLLQDDPLLRWTLSDIENWLEGRRQSPKSGNRRKKAGRPLTLGNQKYFYPELLAYDLDKSGSEGVRLIDSGEFEQWVTRALEDTHVEARIEKLKHNVEDAGQKDTRDRRLLSSMAMALHPQAPLRYEGLSVMPQGFGAALSETVAHKGNIRPYLDLIQSRLVVQWLEIQEVGSLDISSIFSKFDSCRTFLNQANSGYGFERCLYTMDPECPCLSEKIAAYSARSPEDILMAFEEVTKGSSKPIRLFDRHVTAFLMSCDRKNIEPHLPEINAPNEHKKLIGELRTLATVQKRTRSAQTPHLAKWFASQADIFLSRIHDREERKKLSTALASAAESGDLTRILMLIDNPMVRMNDINNFRLAMQEYSVAEREGAILHRELESNPHFGRGTGRSTAAAISAIIAFLIIALTVFVYLNKGSTQVFF